MTIVGGSATPFWDPSRRKGQSTRSGWRPAPPPFKVGWSAATCTVTLCPAAQKSVQTRWHTPMNDEHSSRIRSGRVRRDPPAMCCPYQPEWEHDRSGTGHQ